jgi:5-methylcytosine-specific restriction endonuclease McrA
VSRAQLRDKLFAAQKGRCFYCRRHMVAAGAKDDRAVTLDEVVAQSVGGPVAIHNCVAACERCNSRKADRPVKDFLREERPGRPLRPRTIVRADAAIAKARQERKMRERRKLNHREQVL